MTWTRWKGLLALAVLTSITGNVMHAVLVAPTVYGWGAAVAASIAPVFLFWHTHNLITAPVGSRRGDWVGAAVISMIALGAFAVSFMGLRELLITFGFAPAIAVILPLVVDVTIAGAGWELVREDRGTDVTLDHEMNHLDDWAARPTPTVQSAHEPTHPAVHTAPVTRDIDMGVAADEPVLAHAWSTVDHPVDSADDGDGPVGGPTDPVVVQAADLVAREVVQVDQAVVEEVIRRLNARESVRSIAAADIAARGTVTKIRDALPATDGPAIRVVA